MNTKSEISVLSVDWKKPLSGIFRITPEDAQRVLDEFNIGNRLLRGTGSKYIAKQILNDEWVEDHPQPICFSEEGRLLDGQHRLSGIILADRAVFASVRFGLPSDLIKYMDTGISRTLGDRVHFVDNTAQNATIASWITMEGIIEGRGKGKLSPEEAREAFFEKKKSWEAVSALKQTKRAVGTATVGVACVHYHHRYGNEALDFYHALFQADPDIQPARMLKNFLFETTKRQQRLYPYCVGACLAHHDGRTIKLLRASSWK